MKTKNEYGADLYRYYLMWKNFEGKTKEDYELKIKQTDIFLRSAEQ